MKSIMARGPGITQRKILLLLLTGAALAFSGSPRRSFRALKLLGNRWRELNRENLSRSIRLLYESRLISERENHDGSVTMVLTKAGRKYALTYTLDGMKAPRQVKWDGLWRLIAFDIPEVKKKEREVLRFRLLQIGFKEYQKSIFIYPYPCDKETDFLIEFYRLRQFVRKISATHIDNDLHYRKKFDIL